MPIATSYPGVYIQELPSGVHPITGVATSITAFIGRAQRGPLTPTLITSYADYERLFGGLWLKSTMSYAVRDFFLNGGSQAVIVRIFKSSTTSITGTNTTNDTGYAQFSLPVVLTQPDSNNPNPTYSFIAANPGTWGNALSISAYPADPIIAAQMKKQLGLSDDSFLFNLKIADTTTGYTETFNNLTFSSINNIAKTLKNQSKLLQVNDNANASLKNGIKLLNTFIPLKTTPIDNTKSSPDFNLIVKTFTDNLTINVDKGSNEKTYKITITNKSSGTSEIFDNITLDQTIKTQLAKSLLIDVSDKQDLTNVAGLQTATSYSSCIMGKDGDDGDALTSADIIGDTNNKTGIYSLETVDLFNLLCIPPYSVTKENPIDDVDSYADVDDLVWQTAAQYCEKRRAFLIVDAPASWNSANNVSLSDMNMNSSYAALFFPRITYPNLLRNNQIETFVPCGAIAGTMARIDTQRGVWKAPAGLEANLKGIAGISVSLNNADSGILNPQGVNCLRTMSATGPVIWGARTLQGDDRLSSDWKYISIRRLALYIEESCYRGTQWVVFEPNDDSLWRQITVSLTSFMNNLFQQGAFPGRTPKEAYFVKCDKETTTPDDTAHGIVNIKIGFAPLYPAEFVVISLQQFAGQSQ